MPQNTIMRVQMFFLCVKGTSPGGIDVQEYQSVGVKNKHLLKGLQLHHGQKYYASVNGRLLTYLIFLQNVHVIYFIFV